MEDTKIIYHIDDEDTPYLVKISAPSDKVTLGDFKTALNRPSYKFFFKSVDADFGVVKEEITEDSAHLPCFNGKVIAWLVSADSSTKSDNQSGGAGDAAHHTKAILGPKTVDHGLTARASTDESKGVPSNGNAMVKKSTLGNRDTREDCDTCAETDSMCSADHLPPLRNFQDYKHGSRLGKYGQRSQGIYDTSSSMLSSDLESTSFFDSEDESSRFSTATGTTMSSARYGQRRRQRRRRRLLPISRVSEDASSYSSMTDSTMSLNIVTVTLNMDTVNFLGISIVGQSNRAGDGGIYVGSIMRGGAVAQDGRIEPGDMLLEVNGISFEDMSNDDAVRVLREQVQKPGPITLVVAKCWDPNPKGYFTLSRQEPVRPIDPRAWVLHTNAMTANDGRNVPGSSVMGIPTVSSGFPGGYPLPGGSAGGGTGLASLLPQSQSTLSPAASGSSVTTKSLPDSDLGLRGAGGVAGTGTQPSVSAGGGGGGGAGTSLGGGGGDCFAGSSAGTVIDPNTGLPILPEQLTLSTDMAIVVRAMLAPDSGLAIHDRTWLKITIPNAVIGSDLVDWLYAHIEGFTDRRDVRRYASNLLKYGYIQHTVNKSTFSEQCYYVFTDMNSTTFPSLNLEDLDSVSEIGAVAAARHSMANASNGTAGPYLSGGSGGSGVFGGHTSVQSGPPPPAPPTQQTGHPGMTPLQAAAAGASQPFWASGAYSGGPQPQQSMPPVSHFQYPQPMLFPPTSMGPVVSAAGYPTSDDVQGRMHSGGAVADQQGHMHQSGLTSEALAAVSRGLTGSQSTSGSSGSSSSSSSSSSCSSDKLRSALGPPSSSSNQITPMNKPTTVLNGPPQLPSSVVVPPSQSASNMPHFTRPVGTASVHSGSGASTASESRSAGSAAAGQLAPPAANRLLPPRPVDGGAGSGNSSMPTQATNCVAPASNQQSNLSLSNASNAFRALQSSSTQLLPVSSASCQKLPTMAGGAVRMSGGGGGGSIADLTFAAAGANSTPQPRIN
uniref:Segment polarity protein dishevelled homolog DVL-3 n=1 Tax=Schistocephalus solidus TaxID=70667 RepID=A0A0X3Q3B0_SCHSO